MSSANLTAEASASFIVSLELTIPVPTSSIGATKALRVTAPAPFKRLMSGAAVTSKPKLNKPEVSAPMPLLVSPKVFHPETFEVNLTTSLPKL